MAVVVARRRRLATVAALLVGTIGLWIAHVLLQGPAAGPFVYDEAGYLGNARWLAGDHDTWIMHAGPYYRFGYSLVLAPLFALFDDPGDTYEAMAVLNAGLVSTVLPLVYAYLRRVHGVGRGPALIGAAVAAIHPAVAAYGGIAFAENLLYPLFVVVLLAAWWFVTGAGWRALLVGPAVVAVVAVHSRFGAVALLTLALLALVAFARPDRRRVAAVNAVVILVGMVAIRVVDQALVDARWVELTRPHATDGGVLGLLTDPRRWDVAVARAAGQGWYLLLSSAGLITVALVVLVARSRAGAATAPRPVADEGMVGLAVARARAAAWARRLVAAPRRLAALFLLLVVAAELATSVTFFTIVTLRPDHLIYGRYNETVLPVLLGIAVAALLRWRWPAVRLVTALNVAAVVVFALIVIHHPSMVQLRRPGQLAHQTITAVAPFSNEQELVPVAGLTVGCVIAFAALGVVTRLTGRTAPWIAALAVVLLAAAGPSQEHAESQAARNARREFPMDISRIGPVERVAYSLARPHRTGVGIHQFWMPDVDFVPWTRDQARPTERWVVDRVDAGVSRADDLGARMVLADASTDEALWLMPGPELDRYLLAGRVLPPRLDEAIPVEARQGELDVLDDQPGPVRVDAGDELQLRLRVRHAGTGTAWVDDRSWSQPGVVRVGSRWALPGATPEQLLDSPARGRLPRTVWPGQSVETEIMVPAADKFGEPLAPGTYTLRLDLLQESVGWWVGPGSERLVLDVVVE